MKINSSRFLFSITIGCLLSVLTAFGQTNTTGTNWTVTIIALDPSASEAGDPGQFRVSRGTNTTGNLSVFLMISGTALNGGDYQAISNRVLITDGASSVTFAVTPIDDATPEPTESVTVRIILAPTGFFPYLVGAPNTATVNILDDDGFVASNQPPVVNIVQPTNNAFILAPTNLTIRASAQDSDGAVASVEFFANGQSLGFGSAANPNGAVNNLYSLTWNNVLPGGYDLTARATDNNGATRISQPVHIFVGTNQPPPTNGPPVITLIRPSDGAVFARGTPIVITADTSSFDGALTNVEFFANTTLIHRFTGFNTASFFTFVWTDAPVGTHLLRGFAWDRAGAVGTSAPVQIIVSDTNAPPTNMVPVVNWIRPTNGASFSAGSTIPLTVQATDADGSVNYVEFFATTTNEPSITVNLGRASAFVGPPNSQYTLFWLNAPAGSFRLQAVGVDNFGARGFSDLVEIVINGNGPPPNQPPMVNIVQPTNNAVFPAQANIDLRAFAQDFDGTVASVEFFANSVSLGFGSNIGANGTVGTNYFLTWSNVATGIYDITAQAIDDDGDNRFSQVVHITVGQVPPPTNRPPIVNIIQPANNAFFPAPTNILIRASTHDTNGFVALVEFFANNQSLGFGTSTNSTSALTRTFFLTWSNVPTGAYDLTAKATDNEGAMSISPLVHIFVGTNQPPPPTNQPPFVGIIQPLNNAVFPAPATISLRAFALDHDGFVTSVEFFANNQSLGFGTNAPLNGVVSTNYFLTWSNPAPGAYDLTAKATDDDGAMRISFSVRIFVGTNQPPPTNQPPFVNIVQPTNNAFFVAPASIPIRAFAQDFDGFVASVEFFANNQSLGFGSNVDPNGTLGTNYFLTWSNVPPGVYDLTARAIDDDGAMRTSLARHIFVGTNQPPPPTNQAPFVDIVQPTNSAFFFAPANIPIRASALDIDGFIVSVEFFANNLSLGLGRSTNSAGNVGNQFFLTWSNVPSGTYDLTAKATDDDGAMRFSSPVHILVGTNQPPPPTNHPPLVRLLQPKDGAGFIAPAIIGLLAEAQDFDPFNFVFRVDFFANGTQIGQGVRSSTGAGLALSNQWHFAWSNVVAGEYDLTARAMDNFGGIGFSLPVHILVGAKQQPPPTNQLPVVSITATDPTASEGLVMWCSNTVMGLNWWGAANGILQTNWPCPAGTNTATFTVRRSGGTNHSLNVYYSIGGSASNGVDYSALQGVVTIPAGARAARIVVTPVDDNLREGIETVVLRLIPSHDPQANVPYVIGQPSIAAAYITDNDRPPPPCMQLADGTVHLCWPFSNHCFRVELSTNLVNWQGVCTNRVADGAAHHLDPNATNNVMRFFRIIPVPCPPDGE